MTKREKIEKAVEDLKGKFPFTNDNKEYLLLCKSSIGSSAAGKYYAGTSGMPDPYFWEVICTRPEFEQVTKEKGWINGYKWGVEYPTNGEKPDLDGGVAVEVKNKATGLWEGLESKFVWWKNITKFRIVDERYKPKESPSDYEAHKRNSEILFRLTEFLVKNNIGQAGDNCVDVAIREISDKYGIRTERDELIEKALSLDCEPCEGMMSRRDFVGALIDAGWRPSED